MKIIKEITSLLLSIEMKINHLTDKYVLEVPNGNAFTDDIGDLSDLIDRLDNKITELSNELKADKK